ncbi:unnamed protein product [Hymenolepis diminuta]|uniref:Uncharacterized protein n=1 Tax=Hymenolepis diminuta TaxID=6216 RepID=A0A564Z614_HYMDI|nr:unnamed protein product [Hymenolepis diminuta]
MNTVSRLPLLLVKRCYKPIVIRTKKPLTMKERVGYCIAFHTIFIPPLFILHEMKKYSEYRGP